MSLQKILKNVEVVRNSDRQLIPVGQASADVSFIADGTPGPRVKCIREGGVVRRIEVHCECGRTINLVCDYVNETY